jgi:hypothetical protein
MTINTALTNDTSGHSRSAYTGDAAGRPVAAICRPWHQIIKSNIKSGLFYQIKSNQDPLHQIKSNMAHLFDLFVCVDLCI